jgi:SAM-dependent methyltransferase
MSIAHEGYITDVSYIPGFYANMAPVAMRYVTAINRFVPPAVETGFRYLELGCGLGRSLTTLAAANPAGEFIGVDMNPEHTKAGERDIHAGQLKNARMITADFKGLPADLGEFQFIALHGVFSWVSQEVRDQILGLAMKRLAPGGLLLVSYNAMPGWAHLQPIRGMLRQYAALRPGDSLQRVREAVAYLVYMRDKKAKYFLDNPQASAYVDGMLKQDVRYLAHEYLNESWTSFYFSEVAGMFAQAGLSFIGSLPVFTNFWDLCVRPEFQELFRTSTDRLVNEAHKDFCANTAFRWDIYAKQPRPMPEIADRLRDADDLHFRAARPGLTLPYRANLGVVTSTVQGPLYQALLEMLSRRSYRLSELIASDVGKSAPAQEIVRGIDAGVAMGMFEVSAGPVGEPPADLPTAATIPNSFNRAILASDALGGRPIALASQISGTGHSMTDFDAVILLEFMEGGREGLAARVDKRLSSSGRFLQREGKPLSDPTERADRVRQACENFFGTGLSQLARLGIIA